MFCVFYSGSVSAAPGNGVVSGVFIPRADLPGVAAGEFAAGESTITKEGKAVYGLVNAIYSGLSALTTVTGMTISKGNPSGTGINRFTEAVTLVFQWLADFSTRNLDPIPLNNASTGKVSLADVFPTATILMAEEEIPGEGLLIPDTVAATYGGDVPGNLSADARDWIYALFLAMVAESTLRTATAQSAITTRSNLLTLRVAGLSIPANYYGAIPVAGLSEAQLPHVRVFTDTLTLEYELETNPETQTVEIRVATS